MDNKKALVLVVGVMLLAAVLFLSNDVSRMDTVRGSNNEATLDKRLGRPADSTPEHAPPLQTGGFLEAIEQGSVADTKAHLRAGADINGASESGVTPLHLVSSLGHTHLVNLLIAEGAVVSATDNEGRTPMDVAGSDDMKKLFAIITKYRQGNWDPLRAYPRNT